MMTRDLIEADKRAPITSIAVLLRLAPLAVDAATFEIRGALLNDAQLVLYPDPTNTVGDTYPGDFSQGVVSPRQLLSAFQGRVTI